MHQQAMQIISEHLWTIIIIASLFIQVTPIKFNPWSTFFKWISKLMTADLKTDINSIKASLDTQQKMIEDNEKDRIRWEILDFANSCRNGRKHTRDEFQHVIVLHDKYIDLLKKTGDSNGVFDLEYAYIERIYKRRQDKNDFLTTEGDE